MAPEPVLIVTWIVLRYIYLSTVLKQNWLQALDPLQFSWEGDFRIYLLAWRRNLLSARVSLEHRVP